MSQTDAVALFADVSLFLFVHRHNKEFEETDIVFETPPPDVLRSG